MIQPLSFPPQAPPRRVPYRFGRVVVRALRSGHVEIGWDDDRLPLGESVPTHRLTLEEARSLAETLAEAAGVAESAGAA